jgi:HAD superfamily hydrolase (TIGR01549 family)
VAGKKYKAIIFDIGRVLIRLDIARAQRGLAEGLAMSPQELWTAIEKDPRWKDWQEGRISARDWHLHLSSKLKLPLSFQKFTEVWNLALDPEPIHSSDFFAGLAKRYRIGLLSNTDPIHVAYLHSTYDFFNYFPAERRIYSCMVGVSKPNPAIYQAALKACKTSARESVYVDDIRENVEAAERLGLTGVQYHSAAQLEQDFHKLGIGWKP